MKNFLPFVLAYFISMAASAQSVQSTEAVFLEDAPQLDGKLSEACWQQISPLSEFVTANPVFGNTPQSRTEARVFYGPTALYIGVHCFTGSSMRDDRGLRDDGRTGDWMQVSLDTWKDGRLAFDFTVTAAGVQSDSREGAMDWDAIWQSAVVRHAEGWSAEIRIPYTALRFQKKATQDWGLQITRFDRTCGETSTWSPQNPLVADRVLQFGQLTGLQTLTQERRLSAAVHLGGDFAEGASSQRTGTIGFDGRIGLSPSTTLDFTVLPPWQYSPSQNDDYTRNRENWSDATTHLPRQFDAEESGLFSKNTNLTSKPTVNPYFLYWRLLSDPTLTSSSSVFILNATPSKVLQSSKLTTCQGDWRLGMTHTLLGPVSADIFIPSAFEWDKRTLQGLSNYNVVSVERILPNNGYVNLSNGTLLAGPGYRSWAPSLDFQLRDCSNQYELRGATQWNHNLRGPEAEHVSLQHDYDIRLARINRKWGWHVQHREFRQLRAAIFEPLQSQQTVSEAGISFRDFRPRGRWLNRYASMGGRANWQNQGPPSSQGLLYGYLAGINRLFQQWNVAFSIIPQHQLIRYTANASKFLDRRLAPVTSLDLNFASDSRKRLIWSAGVRGGSTFLAEQPRFSLGTGATWAPMRQWLLQSQVRMSLNYDELQLLNGPIGWVFERYEEHRIELDFNAAWFPVQNWKIWVNCTVNNLNRRNREVVELKEDGDFTPHPWPLSTHILSVGNRIFYNLGFQHYFSNISQLRLQLGHDWTPFGLIEGTGLPPVYYNYRERFRIDLAFLWFLSANR